MAATTVALAITTHVVEEEQGKQTDSHFLIIFEIYG